MPKDLEKDKDWRRGPVSLGVPQFRPVPAVMTHDRFLLGPYLDSEPNSVSFTRTATSFPALDPHHHLLNLLYPLESRLHSSQIVGRVFLDNVAGTMPSSDLVSPW